MLDCIKRKYIISMNWFDYKKRERKLISLSLSYITIITFKIISMILGGLIIVTGYLLYATFILQYVGAFTEIPFNFLQCFMGILIAVPTISALERYGGIITFVEPRK